MNSEILSLLRDPATGDRLEFRSETAANGQLLHVLRNPKTLQQFPIRDGIPVFLSESAVTGSNQRYQALYDRCAAFYDFSSWIFSRWKGVRIEALLREYLDELEIRDGDRVLEVSVGTGRNLQFLPRRAEFFGLDLSWGMLKRCRRNLAKWKLDAALFMGEAEHLPFQEEVFDVVFHYGGINFFNDRSAALREMIRVAKPGTKFVVGDENETLAKKYEKLPMTDEFYGKRKETISAPVDLLPAGMQEVKVKNFGGGDLYCLSFRKPR